MIWLIFWLVVVLFLASINWTYVHWSGRHYHHQFWPKPLYWLAFPFVWLHWNLRPDLFFGALVGKACGCGKTYWQLWYRNIIKRENYC